MTIWVSSRGGTRPTWRVLSPFRSPSTASQLRRSGRTERAVEGRPRGTRLLHLRARELHHLCPALALGFQERPKLLRAAACDLQADRLVTFLQLRERAIDRAVQALDDRFR